MSWCPPSKIQINVKGVSIVPPFTPKTDNNNDILGPSELKLQIFIMADKIVLELKQAITDK